MLKIDKRSFDLGVIWGAIYSQTAHDDPVIAASAITETGADLRQLVGCELTAQDLKSLTQIIDCINPPWRIFVRHIDEDGGVRIEALQEIERAA